MDATLEQRIFEATQCLGCPHEGLILSNEEGLILETSPSAARILETPSILLKGFHVRDFFAIPESYDALIQQTKDERRITDRASILLTAASKRKMVNMSIQLVCEKDTLRYVHVFQDCADLRTMEDRLLQSERLATIGKFASQIAHEIRNPLSSISLNVELLEDELTGASGEARQLIRSVLKELDRLNDIVSEYLQFSRFPKPQLKRGRVDDVIRELAESVKMPSAVRLEVRIMDRTPEIWFDERLLRQVLDNLVRNGVDAIDGEGVVCIETDLVDRFLVIRVKDSGRGIPAEVQGKLFEPFFTTKPQGTGLGLVTSRQIIFEHNGHLMVDSEFGKGSTFTILLPL